MLNTGVSSWVTYTWLSRSCILTRPISAAVEAGIAGIIDAGTIGTDSCEM